MLLTGAATTPASFSVALIRRAQTGDEAAYRELLRAHQRPVHSFIWRMLGPHGSADVAADLTQDTFLKVFRALGDFDVHGSARLSTWIFTIAGRVALNHLRANRRAPTPATEPAEQETPERALSRQQLGVELARVVGELPDDFRVVFLLREYHELTQEEVAQALGVELGTVKSRLSRARAMLRRALGEELLHD